MASRNKIVTTVIILLLLLILFSGCTGKKNIAPVPGSTQKEAIDVSSQNITQSSKEENIPEIRMTSISSVYMHDNSEQKDIYLFSWENIPGNESQNLRSYLRDYFFFNWVDNAQITKDNGNKTIHIFNNEKSIEIILYNDSAQMNYGDGGSRDLIALGQGVEYTSGLQAEVESTPCIGNR